MTAIRKAACAIVALLVALSLISSSSGPAAAQSAPNIIFPIAAEDVGDFNWSDTWGAPRSGGRSHLGVDLLGPKMAKIVAVESGYISYSDFDNADGNWLELTGDSGYRYRYIHLNNDTPGTDNGQATCQQAFSSRLCANLEGTRVNPNTRVSAGEVIAFNGDSGNAENCCAHLHFEIAAPNGSGGFTSFNPTPPVDAAYYRLTVGSSGNVFAVVNSTTTTEAQVSRLYRSFFFRNPDAKGFNYWLSQVEAGASLETIAYSFAEGSEFESVHGSKTNSAYIETIYSRVLGRPSDAKGKAYWLGQLNSGNVDRASIIVYFSEGEELQTKFKVLTEAITFWKLTDGSMPGPGKIASWISYRKTHTVGETIDHFS